jgi:DNA-binding response OmpR family regulator
MNLRVPGTSPATAGRMTSPLQALVASEEPRRFGLRPWSKFVLAVRDPEVATELRHFFVRRGLRPVAAADGDRVLALLEECHEGRAERDCPIELVVADVDLPGVSGVDLLRIVEGKRWPVQVVLLSATHDPALRELVLRSGAAAYLDRPLSHLHLRRVFHRLVSGAVEQQP